MVKGIRYLIVSILLALIQNFCRAQTYADKKYFLIDSLDLKTISNFDKNLIDSALSIFHDAKSDTSKIKAINIIAEESWDENIWPRYNQWVHDYSAKILKLKQSPSSKGKILKYYAGAINNIGYLYNSKGQHEQALSYYQKSLKITEEINDRKGMSGTLINIGYIYNIQGNIKQALDYYYKSLKIEESLLRHEVA